MKKKLITIIAIVAVCMPLVFALSYYCASYVYQYKAMGTSYQSISNNNSGKHVKDTDDKSVPSTNTQNQGDENNSANSNNTADDANTSENKNVKTVYLTFDDGPDSSVTPKILDTLKSYNIKATFFVIGNRIKGNEEVLKRIVDEGNSIGLHSWTHDYKHIYSDKDNFINEMKSTQDEVKKITGVETHIIRFPGGSIKRLNADFLNKLHSLNFHVYDWNATTGDGMYPHDTPEQLFNNLISTHTKSSKIIVLMHSRSNDTTTSEALPRIIDYYQKLGYKFEPISSSTPDFYFKFR